MTVGLFFASGLTLCLGSAPQLQRPGVEDVEVLQKELVQVQTLMDSMTREREEESERLRSHYAELQASYTTSEVRRHKHDLYFTQNFLFAWATIFSLHFRVLNGCEIMMSYF